MLRNLGYCKQKQRLSDKMYKWKGGRDGLPSGFVALRYGVGTLLIINNF